MVIYIYSRHSLERNWNKDDQHHVRKDVSFQLQQTFSLKGIVVFEYYFEYYLVNYFVNYFEYFEFDQYCFVEYGQVAAKELTV